MKDLTPEKLMQIIKDITYAPDNEDQKEIKAFRGCKNDGFVPILHHCQDPTCRGCNHFLTEFDKAFKAEVQRNIDLHKIITLGGTKWEIDYSYRFHPDIRKGLITFSSMLDSQGVIIYPSKVKKV